MPRQRGRSVRKPLAVDKVTELEKLPVVARRRRARRVQLATFSFQRGPKSSGYVLPRMRAFPAEPWTGEAKEA